MKRFLVSIMLVAVVVMLCGCAKSDAMEDYLTDLDFNVISYEGEKKVEAETDLYNSIIAVQYEKFDAENLNIHTYEVEKENLTEASLIVIGDDIIGGYAVCDKGYIYSLDGTLADVTELYNN